MDERARQGHGHSAPSGSGWTDSVGSAQRDRGEAGRSGCQPSLGSRELDSPNGPFRQVRQFRGGGQEGQDFGQVASPAAQGEIGTSVWPQALLPQQMVLPDDFWIAHVWSSPAATALAFPSDTGTAVLSRSVFPQQITCSVEV